MKKLWWKVCNFVEEWIYPGYYLKNLLFYRYDRIKISDFKPYEYYDKNYQMFKVNMQLIVDFIEKEKPEEHIQWYKDEIDGFEGPKYGDRKRIIPIIYQEYEGKWILDIIKEIYNWYKVEYPQLLKEQEEFQEFYLDANVGEFNLKECIIESHDLLEVCFDKENCPKTLEELKSRNYNFKTIKKYLPNEEEWLKEDNVREKNNFIEEEIERQKNKYLHLCIEVMDYLWT